MFFLIFAGAFANEESSIYTEGEVFTPQFCSVINEGNPYLQQIEEERRSGKTFSEAFSAAKNTYHNSVNEYFNDTIELMAVDIYRSNEQNEKLCSPFPHSDTTHSLIVSAELGHKFQQYECALRVYINNPPDMGTETTHIELLHTFLSTEKVLEAEIISSYQALELTIQMYAELRMWHPVHKDLMCLIEQLKEYRNALREFVDEIVFLPVKFYNYGSRYQY